MLRRETPTQPLVHLERCHPVLDSGCGLARLWRPQRWARFAPAGSTIPPSSIFAAQGTLRHALRGSQAVSSASPAYNATGWDVLPTAYPSATVRPSQRYGERHGRGPVSEPTPGFHPAALRPVVGALRRTPGQDRERGKAHRSRMDRLLAAFRTPLRYGSPAQRIRALAQSATPVQ